VVVAEPYRGQGISKAIMDYIMELDFVKGLRRFNLLTASANELYRRYGFTELKDPGRYMEVFKDM
jgi:GNAT superfamily N-acetyltransferase